MKKYNHNGYIAAGRLQPTNAYIKAVAEKILADFCPEALLTPQAIDVDSLIEDYFGFEIVYETLTHNDSIMGMTIFEDTMVVLYDSTAKDTRPQTIPANSVLIDESITEGKSKVRYQFTVAHEAGHIVFDNPQVHADRARSQHMMEAAEEFDPRAYAKVKPRIEAEDKLRIEQICDRFASYIILPEKTVRMAAKEILVKNGYPPSIIHAHTKVQQDFCVDVLAAGIAKIFETSVEAVMYKLKEYKIVKSIEFYEKRKAKYGNN